MAGAATTTAEETASDAGQKGTKRAREEESDEGEAPMDEDESDVSMEDSSDEE